MSKHSPTPWILDPGQPGVRDAGGTLILRAASGATQAAPLANCLRAVACVNACADFENPAAVPELAGAALDVLTCDTEEATDRLRAALAAVTGQED